MRSLECVLEGAGLGGSDVWACNCSCLEVQMCQASADMTDAGSCSAGSSVGTWKGGSGSPSTSPAALRAPAGCEATRQLALDP